MALSDLRKFNFYQKYVWNPTDFENFETWVWGAFEGIAEGAFGSAVLSGLRALPGGGMNVTIDSGIAVNASGRIVVVASQQVAAVASPAGNPARSLIVLRPKTTQITNIPLPTNPGTTVQLHEQLGFDVVVLNGTPSGTPSYPATQAGDIVVAALRLTAAHVTVVRANFDIGMIARPRKKKARVLEVTSGYTVTDADEIIEANFSTASGVVQLPAAGDVEGSIFSIVKTDSSSNDAAVSGNGAELISGQNVHHLATQWQTMRVYSTGNAWRIL